MELAMLWMVIVGACAFIAGAKWGKNLRCKPSYDFTEDNEAMKATVALDALKLTRRQAS